jgi:hypothetical protein
MTGRLKCQGAAQTSRRQEEALDDALKNTFPASDPISVEQPGPNGVMNGASDNTMEAQNDS